jgi:ferredoxin-NADP reductase
LGRLKWRRASLVDARHESRTARTLTLQVESWPGHVPGQHVDIRLTAPDGYTAIRPYSIATPAQEDRLDVTVSLVTGGEVSTYLVSDAPVGAEVEVRGPLGRWFVWDSNEVAPVQLLAGGVGVAPLMAMLRSHDRVPERHPMRLLYSTQSPLTLLYGEEIGRRALDEDATSTVTVLYTRQPPDAAARPVERLSLSDVLTYALPPTPRTRCFVCGSTGFVEKGIELLLAAGFPDRNIRAERFGP